MRIRFGKGERGAHFVAKPRLHGRRRRFEGRGGFSLGVGGVFWLIALLIGCEKKPPVSGASSASIRAEGPTPPATAAQAVPVAPSENAELAGYIFDVPVPLGNYLFAQRVSYQFPHPWEEGLSGDEREEAIWEALILHYESFRRGLSVTEGELEERINSVLKSDQQSFTRSADPQAYQRWVRERVNEETELFENQMRYLLQIDKLKNEVRQSLTVETSESELQQEFLNEKNHLGGEIVTFETREEAQAFYERFKEPAQWEAMKAGGHYNVRPVSLMTLEAYVDLWSIPREQIYAFHAMEMGSVGAPMPFGRQWCVYRLLDKRIGDLAEFPKEREAYVQQVRLRKQHAALKAWIESLKKEARLTKLPQKKP